MPASSLWDALLGTCSTPMVEESPPLAWKKDRLMECFLTEHVPDRVMRNLIDPNNVNAAIRYQNEEVRRQQSNDTASSTSSRSINSSISISSSINSNNDNNNSSSSSNNNNNNSNNNNVPSELAWDIDSTILGSEFSSGRTDITSFSATTRVVANRDRYAPSKRGFNVLHQLHEDASFQDRRSMVDDESSIWSSLSQSSIATGKAQQRFLQQGGCTGFIFLDPCAKIYPTECTRVLNLKMKAHMVTFYRNEFLHMFPSSPIPSTMSHPHKKKPPGLIPCSGPSSLQGRRMLPSLVQVQFGTEVDSTPVLMGVDGSPFMDLAVTGSLGLVDRHGHDTQMGRPGSQLKSPEHYTVLLNRRSGVPLAVCALKSPYGLPVVRIFAIKQRVFGQRPAANTGALGLTWVDSYPLYTWAEITAEGEFPMPVQYSIYMSTGCDGRFEPEPSYKATHKTRGSPEILISGRTELEQDYQGCARLTIQSDETIGSDEDRHFFSLSLARGIDPALFICFAAVVDETMERTMRLKCDVHVSRQRSFRR